MLQLMSTLTHKTDRKDPMINESNNNIPQIQHIILFYFILLFLAIHQSSQREKTKSGVQCGEIE